MNADFLEFKERRAANNAQQDAFGLNSLSLEEIDFQLAKKDYYEFLKRTSPKAWSLDVPHIRLIAEHINAIATGQIDRLAIFMPPRHSKCQPYGSLVRLSSSAPTSPLPSSPPFAHAPIPFSPERSVPIEQIREGDSIVSIINEEVSHSIVRKVLDNGFKSLLAVKTVRGRKIVCTYNHPLKTTRGWVEAKDLKITDDLQVLESIDTAPAPAPASASAPMLFWDPISEIIALPGQQLTIGLELSGENYEDRNYVSDGIVCHNTESSTIRGAVFSLMQAPWENVLVTGYNERFAARLGRKTRAVAASESLAGFFNLDATKQAADEWATSDGGVLMTRGVGSPPTGIGFKRIWIDDPIRRREDAESENLREKVWDWYTDDLYTRLEPNGSIVLVMTRWHEDDLSTRAPAQEPGRWTILSLPALCEDPVEDPLHRKVGAALWPARYDEKALADIRNAIRKKEGERSWQALYQQNPTSKEGTLFHPSKIKVVRANELFPRSSFQLVRSWDFASSEDKGNWTVGILMGQLMEPSASASALALPTLPTPLESSALLAPPEQNDNFIATLMRKLFPARSEYVYILDIVRAQKEPASRDELICRTAEADGTSVRISIPRDPGAAGDAAKLYMIRLLMGFHVTDISVRSRGSKELAAGPIATQVNAGNVLMVEADWNAAFIEEMRSFPNGKNDDQIDALADAFAMTVQGISPGGASAKADRMPEHPSLAVERAVSGSIVVPQEDGTVIIRTGIDPRTGRPGRQGSWFSGAGMRRHL